MTNLFQNSTVLVVEDEEHNWFLIKEFFELFDIKTFWATNADRAMHYFSQHEDISLVLLDMKLPQVSGYEIAPMIKTKRPEVKILAQTAYAQPEDEERCYNVGCDGYISKPFSIPELENAIVKVMNLPQESVNKA